MRSTTLQVIYSNKTYENTNIEICSGRENVLYAENVNKETIGINSITFYYQWLKYVVLLQLNYQQPFLADLNVHC